MKHLKKLLFLILAATLLLAGCGTDAEPKTFIVDDFSITMTNEFEVYKASGFDFAYMTERILMLGIFDEYKDIEELGFTAGENASAAEYLSFVIERNKMPDDVKVQTKDGIDYFTYEAEADGTNFRYIAFVFPHEGTFCFVQFSCRANEFNKNEADFFAYAKSAHFIVGDPNA